MPNENKDVDPQDWRIRGNGTQGQEVHQARRVVWTCKNWGGVGGMDSKSEPDAME